MNLFTKLIKKNKLCFFTLLCFILIFPISLSASSFKNNIKNYETKLIGGKFFSDENYILAGIRVTLKKGWKIYWSNPGEAGLPPHISWKNIENVKNIKLLFPEPKSFKFFNIDTFGYEKELIYPLKIYIKNSEKLIFGDLIFNAQICNNICIPIKDNFKINYFPENNFNPNKFKEIDYFLQNVPKPYDTNSKFFKKIKINEKYLSLYFKKNIPNFRLIIQNENKFIFPESYSKFINHNGNMIKIKIPKELQKVIKNDKLNVSFFSNNIKFSYDFYTKNFWEKENNYFYLIFIALIAGFILNLMPCVLPVLSLKIASLISSSSYSNRDIRKKLFSQIVGIVTSFIFLFITISIIKGLSGSITWGFQFQNDYFLLFISIIIILFSLNLFGFYELVLPFNLINKLSKIKFSKYEDFLTGCLMTILATPCTAPFVGTAIAFAFSGNNLESFIIFLFMAIGMSIPLIILSLNPNFFIFFPKSGKWLLYFKKIMALVFMISGLWLFSIYLNYNLSNIFEFKNFEKNQFKIWDIKKEPNLIKKLIFENKIVFLDITADWCITCKYNKLTVLDDKKVKNTFVKNNVFLLQLDWTKKNEAIRKFIISKGRYGIPLNIIYNKEFKNGILLPELLNKEQIIKLIKIN